MPGEHGYFGEAIAATYDDADDPMFAPDVVEPTVDFLAARAGDGRALELGVGTGRIALPLAAARTLYERKHETRLGLAEARSLIRAVARARTTREVVRIDPRTRRHL